MLPMLAILSRAGGWPGRGGGVVLPSKVGGGGAVRKSQRG